MLTLSEEVQDSMEYDETLQPPSSTTRPTDVVFKQVIITNRSNGVNVNGPHQKINGMLDEHKDNNANIENKENTENTENTENKEKEKNIPNPTLVLNDIVSNKKLSGIQIWKKLVLSILRNTLCYSLMPESGKVVVFDSTLPVKHAFRALAENDIKCAPVWHSNNPKGEDGDFIGFMTVTDFADILHYYAQDLSSFSRKVRELECTPVSRWCTFRKQHNQTEISRAFVHVKPDEPIFNGIYKMHQYFIHRMPVRHKHSILCILNHQTILRFVWKQSEIYHNQLMIRVSDLKKQKTNGKHPTMTKDQKVSDAVTILSLNRRCSGIAICNDDGTVIDAFLRSDIRFFARNQAYQNLNVSIGAFLDKYRPTQFVPKCFEKDNLLDVLQEMLNKRCHVALVLDKNKKLLNIFNYYHIFCEIMENQEMIINANENLDNDGNDEEEDDIIIDTDFLNDNVINQI